jgi:hypothetical protein
MRIFRPKGKAVIGGEYLELGEVMYEEENM